MKNNAKETELELLKGCLNDSERCQELFYRKYYGYVIAISLAYCTNREVAEEVTNDAFMKFFSSISMYDQSFPITAWLRRITINTAIDHYRKGRKHLYHLELDATELGPHTLDHVDHMEADDIYQLMSELPDTLRMVFNLYEVEGYSHCEISKRMGIGESSSRTYLTRAKLKLRQLVKKHFG